MAMLAWLREMNTRESEVMICSTCGGFHHVAPAVVAHLHETPLPLVHLSTRPGILPSRLESLRITIGGLVRPDPETVAYALTGLHLAVFHVQKTFPRARRNE